MFETKFTPLKLFNIDTIYSYRDIGIPNNFYPNYPFIFRALFFRQEKNMNTFVLIVGNPRTSKSYCALKIAEEYSKVMNLKFDVKEQLCFDDLKKFLIWSSKAVNSVFILDETGTSLSPDLWFTLQQRIMRRFVQTQGFRKNVLIWVLPSIIFLQKGFRFLTNYGIKTIRQGLVEIYKIKVNQLEGKGFPEKIETMDFSLPSKETIEPYEKMKKEWNDSKLKDDIEFLEQLENPIKRKLKPLPIQTVIQLAKKGIITKDDAIEELQLNGFDIARSELLFESQIPS